jgi:ADP-heptose:LPS heptosyltransferase
MGGRRRCDELSMNILVIRVSSIGDVILAAPLFSSLAESYPGASITFVTGENLKGLFADDPRLAEIVGIDESPERLLSTTWDLVVDLQATTRSRALCGLLKTASPVLSFDKLHWKRALLLVARVNTYGDGDPVASRYIRAAGLHIAGKTPPPLKLYFKETSCVRMQVIFQNYAGGIVRPAIALFPFSAWKNKEWPAAYFINVGRYFLTKGWNVVIMGGPEDAGRAEWMRVRIGTRCISMAGKLSLYDSGCLLTGFALALGNDTGMSHLARACGVKTGILFGPTTRHFGFYPFGEPRFRVFEERLFCRPCHAHGGDICLRLSHACMRRISYSRVIQELVELAGEGGTGAGSQ